MSAAAAVGNQLFKSADVVYAEAHEGRQFDAVYFAMMVFACLIALMGLLLNSPAVIIGAMLISPLMGPILACGLALTTAEWSLSRKALRNLLLSVVEVIVITVIATHLSPLRDATPEILARTNPNLMDLLIAVFSGLAGTVALASRRTAFTILPGVAIATAVMPPLATVGYGIGIKNWSIAGGAFMLFFTNFTAIVLSASLVFLLIGIRPQAEPVGEKHLLVRWRIAIAAVVLLLVSIPLMRTLLRAASQSKVRAEVQDTLRQSVQAQGERKLDSITVSSGKGAVAVSAAIQTASYMEADEIEQLRSALEKRIGVPVSLQVEQLQLARKEASTEQVIRDFVAAGLVRPVTVEKPPTPAVEIGNLQQRLESSLSVLVGAAGITAQVTSVGKTADGAIVVNVFARAVRLTSADMWMVAGAGLSRDIASPVRMNVTVAATGAGLSVPFRGAGVLLSATAISRVREFSATLPKDVEIAFTPSAGVDPKLVPRRIAQLRRYVSRSPSDAEIGAPSDANSISMVPVQTFKAEVLDAGNTSKPQ